MVQRIWFYTSMVAICHDHVIAYCSVVCHLIYQVIYACILCARIVLGINVR
jgi:hypothetical protein